MSKPGQELWCSEYGADVFSVGEIRDEEGGTVENCDIPGSWWPLYMDDKQVGWVQLEWDGSTIFGIRMLDGHTVEARVDGEQYEDEYE